MSRTVAFLARAHRGVLLLGALACASGTDRDVTAPPDTTPTSPLAPATRLQPQRWATVCGRPGDVIAPGPTVMVSDEGGRAVADVPVTFQVTAGAGMLERTSVKSDGSGIAS